MSSHDGSAASSYDSNHFGDVARAGYSRMYVLSHSALSPLDLSGDYRSERIDGRRKRYDDLEDEYEADDGPARFQLLYMNGRHFFHGTIPLPEELQEEEENDRSDQLRVEDLSVLLPHFLQHQDALTCIDHVTHLRQELRDVVYQMEEVGEFMVEELSKDKIIQRIEDGAREFHWMVSPQNPTFFQLQTYPATNASFADAGVLLIVLKIVVRGVLLDVIYHKDSYFITLRENAEELALEDTFVPNLSCVGPCYIVRRYSDADLKQLLLWCSFPPDPDLFVEGKSPVRSPREQSEQLHVPAKQTSSVLKVVPVQSDGSPSILDANDSQLYCVLPLSSNKNSRKRGSSRKRNEMDEGDSEGEDVEQECDMVFQFNQYIYSGSSQLRLSALNDLGRLSSHVLPDLRSQAFESLRFFGSLAEHTDPTELPMSIRWMQHVRRRFEEIALTLMELVTESQGWVEQFLAEVDTAARESANSPENAAWLGSHLRGWLDNADGHEYFFELETTVAPTRIWGARPEEERDELKSSDINLMLWKGIVNQVVVVVVYRRGSFFVVLREVNDMADMPRDGLEFFGLVPELDSKGRGYLIRKFPAKIERRSQQWLSGGNLMLWQTTGSVVREDLAAEDAQSKWLRSQRKQEEEKETSAWFEEKEEETPRRCTDEDIRRPVRVDDDDRKASSNAHAFAKAGQRDKSGKRHHLAPLADGVRGGNAVATAPWDLRSGRPL